MPAERNYYPENNGQRAIADAGNQHLSLVVQNDMRYTGMNQAASDVSMVRAAQPITLADGTIFQQVGNHRTWIYPAGSNVARIDIDVAADGSIVNGHWHYRSGPYTEVIKRGNDFAWKYPQSNDPNALREVEKIGADQMIWRYQNGTTVTRNGNRWFTQFGQAGEFATIEQRGDAQHTNVFTYKNGKVIVSSDNYKSFTYPPGTQPAGLEAYQKIEMYADGRAVWTKTDGTQIVKDGNTFTYPDGTTSGPQGTVRADVVAGTDNNPGGLRFESIAGGGRIGINQNNQVVSVDNGQGKVANYEYQNGRVVRVKSTDGTVWAIQGQDANGHDMWINNRNQRWTGRITGVNRQGYAQYRQYDGLTFVMGPSGWGEVRNA